MPTNADRSVAAEGTGAGAGSASAPETSASLTRNEPDTSGPAPGMGAAAASANVRSTPVTGFWPPTSDMSITFWPPGPTSSMSMSMGAVWPRPSSVTSTPPMGDGWPVTWILDG